jgi:hypothetical protein
MERLPLPFFYVFLLVGEHFLVRITLGPGNRETRNVPHTIRFGKLKTENFPTADTNLKDGRSSSTDQIVLTPMLAGPLDHFLIRGWLHFGISIAISKSWDIISTPL